MSVQRKMDYSEVIARLREQANPENVQGMARYGINSDNTLGISMPILRKIAKDIGRDHGLALALWASGIHEARILAAFVDEPKLVKEEQMDQWVVVFDSWDVCDHICLNLFDKTSFAYRKAEEWSRREDEFVKRAGFALMVGLAWHDKKACDDAFVAFMPFIRDGATDQRNLVKKAVSWALRQIGKRNDVLCEEAMR